MSDMNIQNAMSALSKFFDKDNDGKISDKEFEEILKSGDTNGDSILRKMNLKNILKTTKNF